MTATITNLQIRMRNHGFIVAYVVLAIGVVAAIWLIDREVNSRQGADNKIRRVIEIKTDAETAERTRANEKQIAALKVVNARQNTIIRALLKARGSNPDLFNGAPLPGDTNNAEQSSASTGDAIPARTGSGTSAAPQPRRPAPTVTSPTPTHTTPKPSSSSPNPPVVTTPAPPSPNPPIPNKPDPPIITPPIIQLPSICILNPLLPCLLN